MADGEEDSSDGGSDNGSASAGDPDFNPEPTPQSSSDEADVDARRVSDFGFTRVVLHIEAHGACVMLFADAQVRNPESSSLQI